MTQNPKQIILLVLEAIGYEDDKERFANDFLILCLKKAFTNLIQELPQEKQDQLNQRMTSVSSEQMESLILEYFSQEKLSEAMNEASRSTLEEYLQTIIPTINDGQRNKLNQFLSSQNSASV